MWGLDKVKTKSYKRTKTVVKAMTIFKILLIIIFEFYFI